MHGGATLIGAPGRRTGEMERMRTYRRTRFAISPEGFSVATDGGQALKEKKIDVRRVLVASVEIEKLQLQDRKIRLAKRQARKSEDPAKKKETRDLLARSPDCLKLYVGSSEASEQDMLRSFNSFAAADKGTLYLALRQKKCVYLVLDTASEQSLGCSLS